MSELKKAWQRAAHRPKWRIDQEEALVKWNGQINDEEDNKLKWMSKISFDKNGLVGVDVKSHQTKSNILYPAITD